MKRINYTFEKRYLSSYNLSWLFVFSLLIFWCCCWSVKGQSVLENKNEDLPDSSKTKSSLLVATGYLSDLYSISSHNTIPYLGLGHFMQEEWLAGSIFLGGEVGLYLLKDNMLKKMDKDNWRMYPNISNSFQYQKTNGLSAKSKAYNDYANISQLLYYNLRLVDFFTAYRTYHAKSANINKVKLPDDGVVSLMVSPFKPKYLTNPWVFVPMILAGTVAYFDSKNDKPLSSAEEITMFNKTYSPSQAALTYGGIQTLRYMAVASGEEMFFRGTVQTELTEVTNPMFALGASSLLFGIWHIPNNGVGNGLAATLAGVYLGYRYEKNGYDLGEVIATHFWLDWIVSLVELARNPRNAQFVYGVKWKL